MIGAIVFKWIIFLRVLCKPVPDLTTKGERRRCTLTKFLLQALASLAGGWLLVSDVFGRLRLLWPLFGRFELVLLVIHERGFFLLLFCCARFCDLFSLDAPQGSFTPAPHRNQP